MNNHITDEERFKRINDVAELMLSGMSIRECASYLTENKYKISYVTVSDYIDRLKYVDKNKYNKIQEMLNSRNSQLNHKSEEVRKRVKNVILLIKNGCTIEQIAEQLTPLEQQVFDLKINGFKYKEIADILDKEPKAIDNALNRIKNKIKNIIQR